ncbi:MAG TPA: outer membrane beta-barrel protein [bacterium]
MKKILSLAAGLMLVASLSFAAESGEGMYLGLGGGLDFPGANWWSGSPVGLAGEIFGGYSFDRSAAIQLDLDGALYSYANGNSTFDLYLLPEFKYTFDNPGFQPYLLAGAGLNLSFNSGGGVSNSTGYFAGVAGGGVQFDLGGNTSLFIEGKAHIAFVTLSGAADVANDFPLTAGLKFPF